MIIGCLDSSKNDMVFNNIYKSIVIYDYIYVSKEYSFGHAKYHIMGL